jgi:DNA-binding IscR family transcriptional regulator
LALLVRAGILSGTTGPKGGFRLARSASQISVLEVGERTRRLLSRIR